MIQITHGAPKTAVTVLMLSSVGAKRVLAMRSEKRQNTAPPRKHAGNMTIGFCVFMRFLIRWGTATPTKETGPANAVTTADSTLDRRITAIRRRSTLTPRLPDIAPGRS